MMIRTLTLAAGLAVAGSAQAGFLGIDFVVDQAGTTAARALGGTLADATVYRLYAAFDQDGFAFNNIFNVNFAFNSGSFNQDPFGAADHNAPPGPAIIGLVPAAEWDTYVTVNGGTAALDGNGLNFGPGASVVGDSGWFTTPPTGLGIPVLNADLNGWFTVLLGQFTVVGAGTRSNAPVEGDYFATLTNLDGSALQGNSLQLTGVQGFGFVPTPGALALFGLAGLTASRRRRSA